MKTLTGKIDSNFGIKIDVLPEGYLTIFLLNVDGKKYPVFFDEKVIIDYDKTVVVTGELSSPTKAEVSPKVAKSVPLKERLIVETLRNIMAETRTAGFEEKKSMPEGPYMIATEILDSKRNILYSIKK